MLMAVGTVAAGEMEAVGAAETVAAAEGVGVALEDKQVPGSERVATVVTIDGPTPICWLSMVTPAVANAPISTARNSESSTSQGAVALKARVAEYVGTLENTPDSRVNPESNALKSKANFAPRRSCAVKVPEPDWN